MQSRVTGIADHILPLGDLFNQYAEYSSCSYLYHLHHHVFQKLIRKERYRGPSNVLSTSCLWILDPSLVSLSSIHLKIWKTFNLPLAQKCMADLIEEIEMKGKANSEYSSKFRIWNTVRPSYNISLCNKNLPLNKSLVHMNYFLPIPASVMS